MPPTRSWSVVRRRRSDIHTVRTKTIGVITNRAVTPLCSFWTRSWAFVSLSAGNSGTWAQLDGSVVPRAAPILAHADAGLADSGVADAETAPLANARFFQYRFDLAAITEVWRHGSIVSSRLLDLTAAALARDGKLTGFAGRVADSGEGRWTVEAAIDVGVPAPVLSAALYARFESRGQGAFANRVLSAMRLGFGGHVERAP